VTCAEVQDVAAAFALGALEPAELAEVARHLASPGPHQGCLEAVDRARRTVVRLTELHPSARPDPGLWRAIEARTGARPRRNLALGPGGFAAVAAAACAIALLVVQRREWVRQSAETAAARASARAALEERDRLRAALLALESSGAIERQALALAARPGSRLLSLAPQPGRDERATAVVNLEEKRAFVVSATLKPRPGQAYELWVLRRAAPPRPAGFLRPGPAGTFAGEVDPSLLQGAAPDALAVSLEPETGSPAPTQVLMVGKVRG